MAREFCSPTCAVETCKQATTAGTGHVRGHRRAPVTAPAPARRVCKIAPVVCTAGLPLLPQWSRRQRGTRSDRAARSARSNAATAANSCRFAAASLQRSAAHKVIPTSFGSGFVTPAAPRCLRAHARFCVRFAARLAAVRCLTAPLIPRQNAYALEHTWSFCVKLMSIQWFRSSRYGGDSAVEAPCTTPYYAMYALSIRSQGRSNPAFPRSLGHRLALDTLPGAGQATCVTVLPTPSDRRTPPGSECSAQARLVRVGIYADGTPRAPSFAVDKCPGAVATAG